MTKLPPWIEQELEASIALLDEESDYYQMVCQMLRNVARNCYQFGWEDCQVTWKGQT